MTTLDRIAVSNSQCLAQMKRTVTETYELLWGTKGQTPQQVCDLMGNQSALGFTLHGKLQEMIYALDPTWVPLLPTHEYVKNADGTVTIGEILV